MSKGEHIALKFLNDYGYNMPFYNVNIKHNIIILNIASLGGAIYCSSSDGIMETVEISNNIIEFLFCSIILEIFIFFYNDS